jgi:hypothetical protein
MVQMACDGAHGLSLGRPGETTRRDPGTAPRLDPYQAPGWRLEQHQSGYHTWTTPSGRQYTTGPTTYPI